jgi:hypothetical protein
LYQIEMDDTRKKCGTCNTTYLQHSLPTNTVSGDFIDDEVRQWTIAQTADADFGAMTNEEFINYLNARFGNWATSAQPVVVREPLQLMHIYIQGTGHLLTVPCTKDMHIIWLQLYVKARTGLRIGVQRLTFAGRHLTTGTLEENGIMNESVLRLSRFGSAADGGAKVIKHTVKAKTLERVVAQDGPNFQQLHQLCMTVMDSPNLNIEEAIRGLSLADHQALSTHLQEHHGKTTNSVKAKQLYEHMGVYKQLKSAVDKCTLAMDRFRQMVEADVEQRFYNEEGSLNFDALKTFVATSLARKEERGGAAAAGAGAAAGGGAEGERMQF